MPDERSPTARIQVLETQQRQHSDAIRVHEDTHKRQAERLREAEERQRRHGEHLAALEDRTAGQRTRIANLEAGLNQVNMTLGRIEDRQMDRLKRDLSTMTTTTSSPAPSPAPSTPPWQDLRYLLIGAILIGMALGRAGIDPTAWLK